MQGGRDPGGPAPAGAPAAYAEAMRAEEALGASVQRAVMAQLARLPSAFDEASGSLAERRRAWRATIGAAPTDLARNDRDALGDGDQGELEADPRRPGFARAQRLYDVWGDGGDWQPPSTLSDAQPFAALCWLGIDTAVQLEIAKARRQDDAAAAAADSGAGAVPAAPSALTRLLETRNALHRLSPLHACIDGSRQYAANRPFFERAFQGAGRHGEVARLLIAAGARVDAKDVAGYSALHHCVTVSPNPLTLAIGAQLVAAGADVRARNRRGVTLMQECVMARRADVLAALLEWGADPQQADSMGLSALAMAQNWPEGARRMAAAVQRAAARARGEGGRDSLRGQRVRLHGLAKAAHLNGRLATVEAGEDEGGAAAAAAAASAALRRARWWSRRSGRELSFLRLSNAFFLSRQGIGVVRISRLREVGSKHAGQHQQERECMHQAF